MVVVVAVVEGVVGGGGRVVGFVGCGNDGGG